MLEHIKNQFITHTIWRYHTNLGIVQIEIGVSNIVSRLNTCTGIIAGSSNTAFAVWSRCSNTQVLTSVQYITDNSRVQGIENIRGKLEAALN